MFPSCPVISHGFSYIRREQELILELTTQHHNRSRTRFILLLWSGWMVVYGVWCFTVRQCRDNVYNQIMLAINAISKQLRRSEIITHFATILDGVWLILKHNITRIVFPLACLVRISITLCHKKMFIAYYTKILCIHGNTIWQLSSRRISKKTLQIIVITISPYQSIGFLHSKERKERRTNQLNAIGFTLTPNICPFRVDHFTLTYLYMIYAA